MNKCDKCGKEFHSPESLEQHKMASHPIEESRKVLSEEQKKKIKNYSIFVVIFILVVGSIGYLVATSKTLPPVSIQGHIEVNPTSHVLKEPMKLEIQKHMLEHADGSGPPGIIINYNCEDYECESDLVENLELFSEKYPSNVYITPFKNMDAKIVLTRLNKIEILESLDEQKIDNFINRR